MSVLSGSRKHLLLAGCFFVASAWDSSAVLAQTPDAASVSGSAAAEAVKPRSPKPQTVKPATASRGVSTGAPGTNSGNPTKREPIKQPVTAAACPRVPGKPYFVEFRSRTAASYGHTFVFHGTLGSGKSFGKFQVAGLHPKGDDPSTYIQGHWMPVEAETGVSYGDLDEQYLTARFCVVLNEAEYKRAAAYIRHLQATTKTWHAPTYNCNSFAADIAKHIGLDTPNPNAYLPETFIKRLAEDNRKKDGPASIFSSMQRSLQNQTR